MRRRAMVGGSYRDDEERERLHLNLLLAVLGLTMGILLVRENRR